MNIIDQARDALNNATPGPWEATTNEATMNDQSNWRIGDRLRPRVAESAMKSADAELIAASPELAAAVVRAAKLADELEREADEHPADDDSLDENYRTAARIRAALEGAEE